jgi:uncharacterized membrane protein
MSEPQIPRLGFWLTASVLGNLVLVGLLAGIFLNAPPKPGRDGRPDLRGAQISREDREVVRALMRESFEAGREAMVARRLAERRVAETFRAEPYDQAGARAAHEELREADRKARDIMADRMFEGMPELTPAQRALVARVVSGNIEKRGMRSERLEAWRERREEIRTDGEAPR